MPEVDDVLAHFGVKGQKWGVRRDRSSGSSSSSRPSRSEDAIRTSEHKARVRKGGTDALTNKELEDLVKRMNLEKQFSTLQPPKAGKKVGKFVADTLLNIGKQQVSKAANDQISKQLAKRLGNK